MDNSDIPPPHIPLPGGSSFLRGLRDSRLSYLHPFLIDLLKYLPGAFDHGTTCSYCHDDDGDPRAAMMMRLDLGKLGYEEGVVFLCPGCGMEEG